MKVKTKAKVDCNVTKTEKHKTDDAITDVQKFSKFKHNSTSKPHITAKKRFASSLVLTTQSDSAAHMHAYESHPLRCIRIEEKERSHSELHRNQSCVGIKEKS